MLTFAQIVPGSNSKLDDWLSKGKYSEVIEYCNSEDHPERLEHTISNYYLGVAFYNTPELKPESIQYLRDYVDYAPVEEIRLSENFDAYYLLAKMYHLTYDFNSAESTYYAFIDAIQGSSSIPNQDKKGLIAMAERNIEQCANGRVAINNPRKVIIENLGDTINTKYPEYAAVVSQDENKIIFTSRRPDTKGGRMVKREGYFEDIYTADLDHGSLFEERNIEWEDAGETEFSIVTDFSYSNMHRMNDIVNSVSHDASIQLSQDEKLLYFYRDSDIWYINIDTDSLPGKAERLSLDINSEYHEPSLFLSSNNERMFLVSDKKGGFGGLDIYMSEKMGEGQWSEPINLGPNVNTPYDEDAPYLDPDNRTLYFSSIGHSSMGEFDIFRTLLGADRNCTPAINLGYPVNTTGDDIYFTMTSRYNRGYYSSNNLNGKGGMDIYRISFADERDPVAELKGYIKRGENLMPAQSEIMMISLDGEESIKEQSDPLDGSYFFLLGTGKTYHMVLETEGFATYERDFIIPEQKEYYRLFQEIHHIHLRNGDGEIIGQQITMYNSSGTGDKIVDEEELGMYGDQEQGDVESYTETKFYMTEDSLSTLMKSDPELDFNLGENGVVKYLDDNGSDKFDKESYQEPDSLSLVEEIARVRNLGIEELIETKNNVVSDSLFFSVQLGAFSDQLTDPKKIIDIDPIYSHITDDNRVLYYSAKVATYEEAHLKRKEILDLGLEGVFVTAYINGKRVSVAKAIKLTTTPKGKDLSRNEE